MAFGFPYPRYEESRTYDRSLDELFAAVQSALIDLRWGYRVLWGKDFDASVPTTSWSWHHDFTVRFPSEGVVKAESRSAYREVLFDLGRNRRNVERFFACMEKTLGLTTHPTRSGAPD